MRCQIEQLSVIHQQLEIMLLSARDLAYRKRQQRLANHIAQLYELQHQVNFLAVYLHNHNLISNVDISSDLDIDAAIIALSKLVSHLYQDFLEKQKWLQRHDDQQIIEQRNQIMGKFFTRKNLNAKSP